MSAFTEPASSISPPSRNSGAENEEKSPNTVTETVLGKRHDEHSLSDDYDLSDYDLSDYYKPTFNEFAKGSPFDQVAFTFDKKNLHITDRKKKEVRSFRFSDKRIVKETRLSKDGFFMGAVVVGLYAMGLYAWCAQSE